MLTAPARQFSIVLQHRLMLEHILLLIEE